MQVIESDICSIVNTILSFLSKIGVIEEPTNRIESIQKEKDNISHEKRYTPALNIEPQ